MLTNRDGVWKNQATCPRPSASRSRQDLSTGLKFFMILVDISQIERMKSKSVSNMDLTDQSSQYFEYQMFIQGTVFGIYLVGLKAICDTVQRSLLTSEMF